MRLYSQSGFDPDFRENQSLPIGDAAQTIRNYLMMLRRQQQLIAAVVVLIFCLIAAYVFTATPLYTSTLKFFFEDKAANVINFQAIVTDSLQDEGVFLGEIESLKSRQLAARVIKKLALDTDPELNLELQEKGPLARAGAWVGGAWVGAEMAELFGLSSNTSDPELEDQKVVDEFLKRLDVGAVGRSRVVEVSFTSESPDKAVRIANTVAEQYLKMLFERPFENSRRASDWLAGQIGEIQSRLEETDRTIASYRATHGLLQGQQDEPLINEQISDLNAKLTEASMDRVKAESTLTQVRREIASRNIGAISKVLESTLVQRFREQELQLAREEAELSKDLGPRHPRAIQLEAEKERFKAMMEAEVQKLVRSLENEVTIARVRENVLNVTLNSVKAELTSANLALAGLNSLERVAASDKLLLEKFQTARSELAAQETTSLQNAPGYVMSPAVIPTRPSFPRKGLMLGGGLVAALLLASMLAFLIERNDKTFRNAPQVKTVTGAPVLSLVPATRGKNKLEQVASEVVFRPHSRFAEAIRGIYTRVFLVGPALKGPSSLLFLSAHTGDGKTTIALSTARLIASQSGSKVLFIDADLRRSEVGKCVGLEGSPGLAGILAGRHSLSEATHKDPISPLHLLLSGQEINSLASFSRDKLQTLITAAKKEYDLVVIDSPPLFALSDAQILTAMADATVLIIRWGRTPQKIVTYALDLVSSASGKIAGIVLSKVRLEVLAKYGEGDSAYCNKIENHYYT